LGFVLCTLGFVLWALYFVLCALYFGSLYVQLSKSKATWYYRRSKIKAQCSRPKPSFKLLSKLAELSPQLINNSFKILNSLFETRYLINDYSIEQAVPWIYAAAIGSYAASMNILPGQTACLACLFPKPPSGTVETCDTAGILNTAVNFAASLQVTETLKYLTGDLNAMRRTLLSYDLWTNERSEISSARPDSECEVCGKRQFVHLAGEARPHITLCGRNSVQIHEHNRPVDFAELAARLAPHGTIRSNELLLRFERPPFTITVFPDGRALIQGTTDPAQARTLYARYIGS